METEAAYVLHKRFNELLTLFFVLRWRRRLLLKITFCFSLSRRCHWCRRRSQWQRYQHRHLIVSIYPAADDSVFILFLTLGQFTFTIQMFFIPHWRSTTSSVWVGAVWRKRLKRSFSELHRVFDDVFSKDVVGVSPLLPPMAGPLLMDQHRQKSAVFR